MTVRRWLVALLAVVAATTLVACGDDGDDNGAGTTTSTAGAPSGSTVAPQDLQPAVWPSPDVVLASPEEAAQGFVTEVLGSSAALGDFRQGDARSGEIDVLFAGEDASGDPLVRSTLFVRQLGEGWFVIGAVSEGVEITVPETNAEVPAGPITVEGRGRGFEGTILVTAYLPARPDVAPTSVVVQGGSLGTLEPFTTTVAVEAAGPGDVVAIVAQGGTGLESDPGDVAALPVIVAG